METHPILNENIHPLAIEVCQMLHSHDYQAFIVGGCVRDLLLGVTPKDWDITTNANPEQVMKIFPKTIPTGLQHGTITVVMGEGVENHFEVTTFRVEGEYKDGRRPEEVFFVQNVAEDLSRRDLTMNAIAYDPITNQIVDPFDGVGAIQHQMIEAVGNATARFQEDGLRIMRVARFAARFGWSVTASTEEGMKANLDTLKKVSKERISDELSKTLMAAHPGYGLILLQDTGALDVACPLLAGRQLPMIPKMHMLQMCGGELETRLAFLYSKIDVTKVEKELTDLKFSGKEVKKVMFLLKAWDFYLTTSIRLQHSPRPELAYRHFIAFFKNEAPEAWEQTLQEFVVLAEALETPIKAVLEQYRDQIVYSKKELLINGNDLLAIGVSPGPIMKTLLNHCYLEIIREPLSNNKTALMEFVRKNL